MVLVELSHSTAQAGRVEAMNRPPTRYTNRLANETSPYLLQHAGNPVDWHPWGDEAFETARRTGKPLLLSIGYSACHWCHVMAHESFEDPQVAALMNEWFVNVKVDREERPDVDNVYMTAVQALTGRGGWPMTVFMTAEGEPFYAGTYFPPTDANGLPGFRRVLEALHHAWTGEREKLLASAEHIASSLRERALRTNPGTFELSAVIPRNAVASLQEAFDPAWGGFGDAPKFPSASNLEFLLAHYARERDPRSREMALQTLNRIAEGGIYDQLGGGFARYSVDRRWLVPHFEKMLYDNAQLARVYLHAFQLTGDARYERVVRGTLDYLLREMRDPGGGFYAALDADSDGVEGKYYVWTVGEIEEALGSDAPLFCSAHGATAEGNFHDPHHPELGGRNVLSRMVPLEAVCQAFELGAPETAARLDGLRSRLLEARARRVAPGLDDKVLTSWNGLVLAALAEAARVFADATYRTAAEQNAAFVRESLWRDGRLLHSYRAGEARIDGMLEDYAYYGLGLIELYRLTGDIEHIDWARELSEIIRQDFHDAANGGFFETRSGGEELCLRVKPVVDAATPSGNGAAALLATWLGRYFDRPDWEAAAIEVAGLVSEFVQGGPTAFGSILQCLEFLLSPARELVILGETRARLEMEREAARRFLPWLVLAPSAGGGGLPLLEGREDASSLLAFLCEHRACGFPARTAEELASQLDEQC